MTLTTKYDSLEELEGKAAKGPWKADFKMIGLVRTDDGAEITKGKRLTSLVQLEANAQFIAAARTAVPDLIADVKVLAEALQAAKGTLVAYKLQPGGANCWEPHDEDNLAMVDAALKRIQGEAE